jgi:uncharacterized membrane protein YuzA (DUF378 family)
MVVDCLIVVIRMCDLCLKVVCSENTRSKVGLVILDLTVLKKFFGNYFTYSALIYIIINKTIAVR